MPGAARLEVSPPSPLCLHTYSAPTSQHLPATVHTVMAEELKKDLRCKSRYKPLCTLLQIWVGWFRGGGHKVGSGKSILCQHPPTKPLLNSSHHQLQANHTTLRFLDHLKNYKISHSSNPLVKIGWIWNWSWIKTWWNSRKSKWEFAGSRQCAITRPRRSNYDFATTRPDDY